jgi:hypothetical protein
MMQEQLQAYLAETLSIIRIQEKLKAETEEASYKVLAELLETKFEQSKSDPSS